MGKLHFSWQNWSSRYCGIKNVFDPEEGSQHLFDRLITIGSVGNLVVERKTTLRIGRLFRIFGRSLRLDRNSSRCRTFCQESLDLHLASSAYPHSFRCFSGSTRSHVCRCTLELSTLMTDPNTSVTPTINFDSLGSAVLTVFIVVSIFVHIDR